MSGGDIGPFVAYPVKELLDVLERRLLLELTDLRQDLREQNSSTRNQLDEIDRRLTALEKWQSNMTGRMVALGAVVAILFALAQFGVRLVTGH